MSNLTKVQEFLPKSFFVIYDNNRKQYFRPVWQKYSGYTYGVWLREEEAKIEASRDLENYEIREINISDIHHDFVRLYDSLSHDEDPRNITELFKAKLAQLIIINIFNKR